MGSNLNNFDELLVLMCWEREWPFWWNKFDLIMKMISKDSIFFTHKVKGGPQNIQKTFPLLAFKDNKVCLVVVVNYSSNYLSSKFCLPLKVALFYLEISRF